MPKYVVKVGFVNDGTGPHKGPGDEIELTEPDAAGLLAQGTIALKESPKPPAPKLPSRDGSKIIE